MAFMDWQAAYSVGVLSIDEQHRALLDIINRLHGVMSRGGAADELKGVLGELVAYTLYHFSHEEQMMDRCGYPGLAEHKRIHSALLGQVEAFQKELVGGRATVSLQLMTFLKDWLSKHILETDMRYRSHMTSRRAA
jgi:hemerythrin-like metal-binding protein